MNENLKKCIVIFCLTFFVSGYAQTSIEKYLNNLCEEYPEYIELREEEYNHFWEKYKLKFSHQENQIKYYKIYFLHDLFTGRSAQNFSSGGILNIPYVWHWVNPNPRYEIQFYKNKQKLSGTKPPSMYSNYKSYADIDRTPFLYLKDLFTPSPKYFHESCSTFYSFGWCSEREMTFNAVCKIIGYESKVVQRGIHTYSEVLADFKTKDNEDIKIVFKIDNTFNSLSSYELTDGIDEWKKQIGQGATIHWYNQKAHSAEEIHRVKSIVILDSVAQRINKLIKEWIKKQKRK